MHGAIILIKMNTADKPKPTKNIKRKPMLSYAGVIYEKQLMLMIQSPDRRYRR
jgi:hypothetical protein